jgi:hypothetical protein
MCVDPISSAPMIRLGKKNPAVKAKKSMVSPGDVVSSRGVEEVSVSEVTENDMDDYFVGSENAGLNQRNFLSTIMERVHAYHSDGESATLTETMTESLSVESESSPPAVLPQPKSLAAALNMRINPVSTAAAIREVKARSHAVPPPVEPEDIDNSESQYDADFNARSPGVPFSLVPKSQAQGSHLVESLSNDIFALRSEMKGLVNEFTITRSEISRIQEGMYGLDIKLGASVEDQQAVVSRFTGEEAQAREASFKELTEKLNMTRSDIDTILKGLSSSEATTTKYAMEEAAARESGFKELAEKLHLTMDEICGIKKEMSSLEAATRNVAAQYAKDEAYAREASFNELTEKLNMTRNEMDIISKGVSSFEATAAKYAKEEAAARGSGFKELVEKLTLTMGEIMEIKKGISSFEATAAQYAKDEAEARELGFSDLTQQLNLTREEVEGIKEGMSAYEVRATQLAQDEAQAREVSLKVFESKLEEQTNLTKTEIEEIKKDISIFDSRIESMISQQETKADQLAQQEAQARESALIAYERKLEEQLNIMSGKYSESLSCLLDQVFSSSKWAEAEGKFEQAHLELRESRMLLQKEYEEVQALKGAVDNHFSRLQDLDDSAASVQSEYSEKVEGQTSEVLKSIQLRMRKERMRQKALREQLRSRSTPDTTGTQERSVNPSSVVVYENEVEQDAHAFVKIDDLLIANGGMEETSGMSNRDGSETLLSDQEQSQVAAEATMPIPLDSIASVSPYDANKQGVCIDINSQPPKQESTMDEKPVKSENYAEEEPAAPEVAGDVVEGPLVDTANVVEEPASEPAQEIPVHMDSPKKLGAAKPTGQEEVIEKVKGDIVEEPVNEEEMTNEKVAMADATVDSVAKNVPNTVPEQPSVQEPEADKQNDASVAEEFPESTAKTNAEEKAAEKIDQGSVHQDLPDGFSAVDSVAKNVPDTVPEHPSVQEPEADENVPSVAEDFPESTATTNEEEKAAEKNDQGSVHQDSPDGTSGSEVKPHPYTPSTMAETRYLATPQTLEGVFYMESNHSPQGQPIQMEMNLVMDQLHDIVSILAELKGGLAQKKSQSKVSLSDNDDHSVNDDKAAVQPFVEFNKKMFAILGLVLLSSALAFRIGSSQVTSSNSLNDLVRTEPISVFTLESSHDAKSK